MLGDPLCSSELSHLGGGQPAFGGDTHPLDAGLVDPEIGVSEQTLEFAVLPREMFGVDQHGEALVESELSGVRGSRLVLPSRSHRAETHGVEFFERWFL
jgi:hypothetical protein